jgi:thioredoxin reductase (NADPH)
VDLLVIGAGPAGMSAALWARRLDLEALVLDAGDRPGGQLWRIPGPVPDYPGLEPTLGADVAARFAASLAATDVSVRTGAVVERLDAVQATVELAGGERLSARFLVLATGVRPRRLGVPGESDVVGRGPAPVAYRHAPAFAGRRVLVVGGGDAALEEALLLAPVAEHVTVAHRGDRLTARPAFVDAVRRDPRIELRLGQRLVAILGDADVSGAELETTEGRIVIPVQGVFVCAGVQPNSELVRGQVDLDAAGFVRTGPMQRTSADRVYAVGDVCSGAALSIAAAVGQGATAVKDIQRRLASADAHPQPAGDPEPRSRT